MVTVISTAFSSASSALASSGTREPRGAYLASEYFSIPPASKEEAGRYYFPTLTPPLRNRATFRYDLGRGMYALEQLLAFQNVTATIRTNVVRLRDGGLWVHGPQWPTGEFMHLLDELGTVRHVVLPCNALEHKAPMRAFVDRYPDATVWISPGQYGPFGSCGRTLKEACRMGYRVDGVLAASKGSAAPSPPWADEFEYETLYLDLPGNAGPVSEVAFYHKPTRTLLAVDAVVFISENRPPFVFETYFDKATVEDPTFWPRTVLQSVFLPLREEDGSDGRRLYPGFEAIKQRLVRAPILRGFNDARAPAETREWITKVATRWPFDRVVTSHFAGPIVATGRDVIGAFSYLFENAEDPKRLPPIACQDWELLDGLNGFITNQKLGAPVVFDYRSDCVVGTSH